MNSSATPSVCYSLCNQTEPIIITGMAKVLAFKKVGHTDVTLAKRVAELAADSSLVMVTKHAKQRMKKRKILLSQVLEVLRGGQVVEHAHKNPRGDWCCTLQKQTSGDLVKVPVVLFEDEGEIVIVITVMS